MTDLKLVKDFWERNPLWTGESPFEPGTLPFYEEHRQVYISDCFAGRLDLRFLPPPRSNGQHIRILDLGCGIGFWVTEFGMRGLYHLHAADLTEQALNLTRRRLVTYGVNADLSIQNAECMEFPDATFDHVNCQGVIHHTPDTKAAVSEIARVLKPGGTACISVYHHNMLLKAWPYLSLLGQPLAKLGGGLKGRGREKIFLESNVNEIVRLYDGAENPVGKSYTRKQFLNLVAPHFKVVETYLHFFPARALPFRIPNVLHRWLDRYIGFMIYATLRKPCAA